VQVEDEIASERQDTVNGEVSFRKRSRKPRTLGSMLDCSMALGRSDIIQVRGGSLCVHGARAVRDTAPSNCTQATMRWAVPGVTVPGVTGLYWLYCTGQ
jgi:hypothetical protein